jgi:hypothetical protein
MMPTCRMIAAAALLGLSVSPALAIDHVDL